MCAKLHVITFDTRRAARKGGPNVQVKFVVEIGQKKNWVPAQSVVGHRKGSEMDASQPSGRRSRTNQLSRRLPEPEEQSVHAVVSAPACTPPKAAAANGEEVVVVVESARKKSARKKAAQKNRAKVGQAAGTERNSAAATVESVGAAGPAGPAGVSATEIIVLGSSSASKTPRRKRIKGNKNHSAARRRRTRSSTAIAAGAKRRPGLVGPRLQMPNGDSAWLKDGSVAARHVKALLSAGLSCEDWLELLKKVLGIDDARASQSHHVHHNLAVLLTMAFTPIGVDSPQQSEQALASGIEQVARRVFEDEVAIVTAAQVAGIRDGWAELFGKMIGENLLSVTAVDEIVRRGRDSSRLQVPGFRSFRAGTTAPTRLEARRSGRAARPTTALPTQNTTQGSGRDGEHVPMDEVLRLVLLERGYRAHFLPEPFGQNTAQKLLEKQLLLLGADHDSPDMMMKASELCEWLHRHCNIQGVDAEATVRAADQDASFWRPLCVATPKKRLQVQTGEEELEFENFMARPTAHGCIIHFRDAAAATQAMRIFGQTIVPAVNHKYTGGLCAVRVHEWKFLWGVDKAGGYKRQKEHSVIMVTPDHREAGGGSLNHSIHASFVTDVYEASDSRSNQFGFGSLNLIQKEALRRNAILVDVENEAGRKCMTAFIVKDILRADGLAIREAGGYSSAASSYASLPESGLHSSLKRLTYVPPMLTDVATTVDSSTALVKLGSNLSGPVYQLGAALLQCKDYLTSLVLWRPNNEIFARLAKRKRDLGNPPDKKLYAALVEEICDEFISQNMKTRPDDEDADWCRQKTPRGASSLTDFRDLLQAILNGTSYPKRKNSKGRRKMKKNPANSTDLRARLIETLTKKLASLQEGDPSLGREDSLLIKVEQTFRTALAAFHDAIVKECPEVSRTILMGPIWCQRRNAEERDDASGENTVVICFNVPAWIRSAIEYKTIVTDICRRWPGETRRGQEGRECVGLENHGSTCYINAVLQCIYHSSLRGLLVCSPASPIGELFESMHYRQSCRIQERLRTLVHAVWQDQQFAPRTQCDAFAFLRHVQQDLIGAITIQRRICIHNSTEQKTRKAVPSPAPTLLVLKAEGNGVLGTDRRTLTIQDQHGHAHRYALKTMAVHVGATLCEGHYFYVVRDSNNGWTEHHDDHEPESLAAEDCNALLERTIGTNPSGTRVPYLFFYENQEELNIAGLPVYEHVSHNGVYARTGFANGGWHFERKLTERRKMHVYRSSHRPGVWLLSPEFEPHRVPARGCAHVDAVEGEHFPPLGLCNWMLASQTGQFEAVRLSLWLRPLSPPPLPMPMSQDDSDVADADIVATADKAHEHGAKKGTANTQSQTVPQMINSHIEQQEARRLWLGNLQFDVQFDEHLDPLRMWIGQVLQPAAGCPAGSTSILFLFDWFFCARLLSVVLAYLLSVLRSFASSSCQVKIREAAGTKVAMEHHQRVLGPLHASRHEQVGPTPHGTVTHTHTATATQPHCH